MKRLLPILALLCASSTYADQPLPPTSFTGGGNITAASASCLVTNCVLITLPSVATTLTVGVTGTFSATLKVEESQDGGRTWTSAGSDITSTGTTNFTITAFTNFRVRASAFVSGNAGVNLLAGPTGGGGGGGGGGGTPGGNTPNLQYKSGASSFGGATFDYNAAGSCQEITVACDNIANDGSVPGSGFVVNSGDVGPTEFNYISAATAPATSGGGMLKVYTASSNGINKNVGPMAVAGFFRASVSTALATAVAIEGKGTTFATDATDGQNLNAFSGSIALNNTRVGSFVGDATSFLLSPPGCDFGGCTTVQVAHNLYGLKIQDQKGFSTIEQAALKIESQTAGSGTTFSIKCDTGCGLASFGDGLSSGATPPSVTPGTGGVTALGEGTVPSVGAASGVDLCYADSTSHTVKCSFNNGSYFVMPQEVGSGNVTTAGTAVTNGTCQAQTGITVTGTATTDSVIANIGATLPATWQTGIVLSAHPTATNTVTVYLCNPTAGSITPAATAVNVRVVR